jgi:lipopolysaccharide exporter
MPPEDLRPGTTMTAENEKPPDGRESPAPSSEPLARRVIKGGFWVFGLRFFQLILYFARLVILARLLAPRDFGSIGIALLVMSILEAFTQTGTLHALIQKKDDIRPYFDAAWTVSVIRGASLGGLIFVIAPVAARFFGAADVAPVIRGYALALFIGGFNNPGIVEFQKNLEFRRQARFLSWGNLTSFVVVVSGAFILRSVWAFVIADVANRLVLLILSYRLHSYRPRWSWRPERVRELFRYGRWVTGTSALSFLTTQGDDILVGKLLGPIMLGFYQMAYKVSNMPTTEISAIAGQVMFPTYAKLQDDRPRLREAYFKALQVTIAPAFMLVGLLFALGPDLVRAILGEKWLPMVSAMKILALAGTARAILVTIGDLTAGIGRPQTHTGLESVRLLVMAALVVPLTLAYGLPGASAAVLAGLVVPLVGFAASLRRVIDAARWEFLRSLSVPAASGLALGAAAAATRLAFGGTIAGLLAAGAAGLASFLATHLVLERFCEFRSASFVRERVWPLIKELVSARRASGKQPG